MARGNRLLRRLLAHQDAHSPLIEASSVSNRAFALLTVTLVSGAIAWIAMSAWATEPGEWPGLTANLIGAAGFAIVAAILVYGAFRPVAGAGTAVLYAVAQGCLLAWLGTAFDLGSGGLLANALLGTVLTGLAALAIRRAPWGTRASLIVVPATAAGGLAALALANAVLAATGRGLFATAVPWWGWWLVAALAVWSAYSYRVDLDLLDQYLAAGARDAWPAALAVATGPVGVYLWRLSDFRSRSIETSY
ncbi:hypothetical protein AB0A73_09760 [Glycomyces sp. NPDC047369]